MKKQFFAAAMILALGAGFTACSNDDLGKQEGKEVAQNADSYMSVTFTLPKASATRAATAADGQDKDQPDYNYLGTWNGADDIKKVKIYVFNGTDATSSTLEVLETVTNPVLTTVDGNIVVKSPQPFKISAGNKRVFVVVNPTAETDAHLNANVGTTTLAQFTQKYATDELSLTLPTTAGTTASTVAEMLAKRTADKDEITMTGSFADKNIIAGVSSSEAASGAKNNVDLNVKRVVASVVVSTKASSYKFGANDPATNTVKADFVKVSDLSYVVAQGEKKLYLVQASNVNAAADGAYKTPSYSYIPQDDYNTQASTYYDYSGLKSTEAGRKTDGLALHELTAHGMTELTPKFTKSVFVLPTVHKFNADREQSGYRKGNTPYVLVRGYLTPEKVVATDGTLEDGPTLGEDADLFYGETTGFFYKSLTTSQDVTKKGVAGQKVRKFTKRVVLYWAWLNPDANNVNSPVIRNNIYNIHITGINNLGGNWNPLVPNDPNNPNNPVNPNPKPTPGDNPNEPDTPPVDPNDPLTLDKTWMSTNVTILPWQVHSREIELSL